ncbi:MAG: Crp/Fnr family transcriptional regulator [Phenylobacterium sp.]|uniref:Crp/Fnr family transcriptional regulator n=1 Tax=Phenylobacterium sp. TaxID=1871053 RepID=UPI00391CA659
MHDPLRSQPNYDRLLDKLESMGPVTQEQRAAIRDLPIRVSEPKGDEDLVREGDAPKECCLVLEGFACRYKLLPDGRRQILSFHVPGDIPDLQSLHLRKMDHSLAALLPSRVVYIPHEAIRRLTHAHPRLTDMLWRDTLVDAAVFREWMVGLGRRSAYARIAHLFCELVVKFRAVGLAKDDTIELRLTQVELADALGLSSVHVNRVLQQLRGEEIIQMRTGRLQVLEWSRLTAAGEFNEDYLHLAAA